jgi:hypothetical protein
MTRRPKAVAKNEAEPGDTAPEELNAEESPHTEVIRRHAAAIEKLADAINNLSVALASKPAQISSLTGKLDLPGALLEEASEIGSAVATSASASLFTATKSRPVNIAAQLAAFFGVARVSPTDPIFYYVSGGSGTVAALWEPLCDWPAFKQFNLSLGPSDLRFVSTVGDLINVIAWGLRKAA